MIYGYARAGTSNQDGGRNTIDAQRETLEAAGAEIVYEEAFTGIKKDRPKLNELLDRLQRRDVLIVTRLDRIAGSASQGEELIKRLLDRGVTVRILDMGVLDDTPTGQLIMTVISAFAEFERELIIERTQEGKDVARTDPNYREGRPRKYTAAQFQQAMSLLKEHSYKQVESMTGISVPTLAREKRKQRLIEARYSAPSEEDIMNASLDGQMDLSDFLE